ncbi:biopolymer transporter ExbD [bacterium]|nr:biopolymer transporter ExbD [bacterium]MBU1025360.1 biopolymer transporter ExbD [bacterium]
MKDDLKLVSEINITPLTDVMLVLLIIFMISAPFIVPRGKEVHLPKVKEFKTLKSENNLLIIAPDGSLALNGLDVSIDEFRTSLENIVDASTEPVNLFIKGDESVDYGLVVKAMDNAKIAGVERISLVSEVEEAEIPVSE